MNKKYIKTSEQEWRDETVKLYPKATFRRVGNMTYSNYGRSSLGQFNKVVGEGYIYLELGMM